MIACTFKSSNLTVDASFNQAPCCCRVKQQMIDAKAGVAWPSVSLIIPERVHRRIRMYCADRVDPTVLEQSPKQSPRSRLHQRVLCVGPGGIDVGIGRRDIEIPGEHDRRINGVKLGRMGQESLHPGELVFEFRSRLRVAVGCIERRNQHTFHRRFDIAALPIVRIAWQREAG